MRHSKDRRRRLAASEVMGVVIMVAVTISVGFTAWAWAKSASLSAEKSFGNSVQSNVNCVEQNFVITNVSFNSTNHDQFAVYFLNNGIGTITISILTIGNTTWSWQSTSSYSVTQGDIKKVTFNVPSSSTTQLSGQWDRASPSLYTFNAVARCQGDIVSNYLQVW